MGARIKREAEKIKRVLSANQKKPFTVSSLYEDKDYKSMFHHSDFEEMTEDLFARVLTPAKDALEMANMTTKDIDQIEIIGGGIRIPKIQELIKEYFGVKDLGVHLNGDEAVVLGSAFRAANISKAFRVGRVERSVGMNDVSVFPLGVRLKNAPEKNAAMKEAVDSSKEEKADGPVEKEKVWSKKVQLFKPRTILEKKRMIKFQHDKDIVCSLQYEEHPKFPEHANQKLGGYHITGIEAFVAEANMKELGKPTVLLTFKLDGVDGILKLIKAEATLEEMIIPAPDPAVNKTGDENNETVSTEENKKEGSEKKENETKNETEKNATGAKEVVEPPKPKKRVHRRTLKFVFIEPTGDAAVAALSSAELAASVAKLKALDDADAERKIRDGLKNDLETYVFSTRSKIREAEEEVSKVSTDEEREKIMEDLEAIEEWLYEDGEDGGANAPTDAYKQKMEKMDKRVNAIFHRLAELEARPKAIEAARSILEAATSKIAEWAEVRPQISEDDAKSAKLMVEEVGKWLDEKEKKQAELATTDTPAFSSTDVKKQIRPLSRLISSLLSKKLPSPIDPNVVNMTDTNSTATGDEDSKKEEGEKKDDKQEGDQKEEKKEEGEKAE